MNSFPPVMRSVTWSKKNLDLDKDRDYIVNQILAFGTLEELQWLFNFYDKNSIRQIFLNQPIKQYTPASLNFARLLLDIVNPIDPRRYDKTLPRHIG